jgi:hypothetical protein
VTSGDEGGAAESCDRSVRTAESAALAGQRSPAAQLSASGQHHGWLRAPQEAKRGHPYQRKRGDSPPAGHATGQARAAAPRGDHRRGANHAPSALFDGPMLITLLAPFIARAPRL